MAVVTSKNCKGAAQTTRTWTKKITKSRENMSIGGTDGDIPDTIKEDAFSYTTPHPTNKTPPSPKKKKTKLPLFQLDR